MAACSSGDGSSLEEVAERLHGLERASVSLRVESGGTGFTIDGAFSIDGDHALPVARLTHRPLAEDGQATTVVLTGDDGFVEVDGEAYRLPPEQLDALRVPEGGAASAISELRLEAWLVDGGGDWSGEGDPDVVLPDVVALATGLGASDVLVDDVEGELAVEVEAEDDGDLRSLSATAEGFSFTLELADHGEPVAVEPPESARPYGELGR